MNKKLGLGVPQMVVFACDAQSPVGAVHYSALHRPSVLDTPALQDCAKT